MDKDYTAIYRYLGGRTDAHINMWMQVAGYKRNAAASDLNFNPNIKPGGQVLRDEIGCDTLHTYQEDGVHAPFWLVSTQGDK